MKAKLVLAIFLLCGVFTVNAQDNSKVEKNAKAETEKIVEKFQLDQTQDMVIYRQNVVFESDLEKYHQLDSKSPSASEFLKNSQDRYMTSMQKILNKEQYAEFSKMIGKDKRMKK